MRPCKFGGRPDTGDGQGLASRSADRRVVFEWSGDQRVRRSGPENRQRMTEVVMRAAVAARALGFLVVVGFSQAVCLAQTVIDSDFSKGRIAALGWKATGDWDVFTYPKETPHNPGPVARLAARKGEGSLTKTFDEIKNPSRL